VNVRIRAVTAEDYDRLCPLFEEVDRLHRRRLPDRFRSPEGTPRPREDLLRLIGDPEVGLFAAEVDGRCAGCVHVALARTPDSPVYVPCRYALIDEVVVASAFRHQGIGRALMEHAHSWARSKGAARIELNVYEFNSAAIRLYRRMGYADLRRTMSMRL